MNAERIQARIREIHAEIDNAILSPVETVADLQRERYRLRRELHELDPSADLVDKLDWLGQS